MRRKGTLLALANALAAVVLITYPATDASAATSAVAFKACASPPTFGCGHLAVPLDPTNRIPGTVTLAIRRQLSATGTATTAIVALAGGPGQSSIPFAEDYAQIVAPALATDDLVVFDQRGTGYSGALKCPGESFLTAPASNVIPGCALEIGATRGLYTTDDTVADIEAIRKALGYTKLILYGTSYGTKVALRYAAEYPNNVAGLILDSTVTPNGPDAFDQTSYAAVPRIVNEICASGACPRIPHPEADLGEVLKRLGNSSVEANYVNGRGRALRVAVTADDIASLLFSGDDDPVLRAEFPAAIAAAAAGRYGLLAILVVHAVYGAVANKSVDSPLFFDTECEELSFPWVRTDTPAQRAAAARRYARTLPPGSFGPFDALTAYQSSTTPDCAYWPFASAAPEPQITALPNVPTLILSGADDMRTPTSNARAVAAMISDATVVVVPKTGHSVLTTETGLCAQNAVDAFLRGTAIQAHCAPHALPAYLRPAAPAPTTPANLQPLAGTDGFVGRTARALELTLTWSSRELSESLYETLIGSHNPAYSSGLGGLHGGYARLANAGITQGGTIRFHGFSYVPGVTITGSLTQGVGTIAIAGTGAAQGTLVAKTFDDFSGTLGGVAVHFTLPRSRLAALIASAAP